MKINQINCLRTSMYNNQRQNRTTKLQASQIQPEPPIQGICFKGYCGRIAGTLTGIASAVGLAFVAAPVFVCSAPILGAIGLFAGDKAEDKINEAFD